MRATAPAVHSMACLSSVLFVPDAVNRKLGCTRQLTQLHKEEKCWDLFGGRGASKPEDLPHSPRSDALSLPVCVQDTEPGPASLHRGDS